MYLNSLPHLCLNFIALYSSVFAISFPGLESLRTIYHSIFLGHISQGSFSSQISKNIDKVVNVALELHQKVATTFLPTAIKFHYIFNLRDLSNIFQVSRHRSCSDPVEIVSA